MSRAPGAARSRDPSAALLARGAFAALVVASVAALFIAQALKRETPLVNGHSASMAFPGPGHRDAHFHLKTSLGDFVDVAVVAADGDRVVRVIARHRRVREYHKFGLTWTGATASGVPARPGVYEIQVRFERAGRTVIVPNFELTFRGSTP